MSASFNKYQSASKALLGALNAGTDTWKIALTNAVNAATDTTYSSAYDLATGAGYTNGGNTATVSSFTDTSGTTKLVLASPTAWTATGSLGPFRYVVLYDATTNDLIGYWDYGSSITLASGDTFTPTLDATNGVFSIA